MATDERLIRLLSDVPVNKIRAIPGLIDELEMPGLRVFKSSILPNPFANFVGMARLANFDVDKVRPHHYHIWETTVRLVRWAVKYSFRPPEEAGVTWHGMC